MKLLLVRHAEAIGERPGLDDGARWLSERGRAQAREVAAEVRARGIMPTRVVASPRMRTVQTAELFAQALGFLGVVESLPSLSYTVPAERAARDLSTFEHQEVVAAFGHMPTIAEIAHRLTAQQHQEGFAPSQALWIEDGRVVWSLSPR